MHTFIHTDGHNLFHRQINMTNPALGIDNMIGMAFHMLIHSMRKEYIKWAGTHTIFYLEGRSWRKDFYPNYKANRAVAFLQQTEREQENHRLLVEAFDDFVQYLNDKTNITVLQNPTAEADDLIAIFIEAHPNDRHILISSDSDFFQLLRHTNVMIYDPVKDIQIKQDGIYDDDGNKLAFIVDTNAKIKVGAKDPTFVADPDWFNYALFLKCIRGDKTDYIFSAYPGVREKGTKKQVGIREAYEDKAKGYAWNNFMMQKWIDHDQTTMVVKDRYEFNRKLIDLGQIPDNVKMECLEIIASEIERKDIPAVEIGTAFMRFCGKWNLKRIGDNSLGFMPMLKSKYRN